MEVQFPHTPVHSYSNHRAGYAVERHGTIWCGSLPKVLECSIHVGLWVAPSRTRANFQETHFKSNLYPVLELCDLVENMYAGMNLSLDGKWCFGCVHGCIHIIVRYSIVRNDHFVHCCINTTFTLSFRVKSLRMIIICIVFSAEVESAQ